MKSDAASGATVPGEQGAIPVLSVIVVNWNTKDLLRKCVVSVETQLSSLPHEIIVIDNGSSDGSAGLVASELPAVRLVCNTDNLGFGRANNQGMAIARGEFFLLLNSDARLRDASIGRLVDLLRRAPDVGVVGPRLEDEDQRLQPSAFRFGSIPLLFVEELGVYKLMPRRFARRLFLGGYWDHSSERTVDVVSGACMLVRRQVFEATRGFDPSIFLYGEEEEWCRRMRVAGWKVVYSPQATVVHLGHATTRRFFGEEDRIVRCLEASDRLLSRNGGRVAAGFVPALRIAGAVLKLVRVRIRSWFGKAGSADDEVCDRAWIVLRHYTRYRKYSPNHGVQNHPRA